MSGKPAEARNIKARLETAVRFLRRKTKLVPEVAIVLGSGLGELFDSLKRELELPYAKIPGFRSPTVPGHSGKLLLTRRQRRTLALLGGRIHAYEGGSLSDVVFPVRSMALWGARVFVLTNAAGGISDGLEPGDLMLVTDHVNLLGGSPLEGASGQALGNRFLDMSRAYDPELAALAEAAARDRRIPLKKGIYVATSGPNYETPAEIRMMRSIGADAVGMSTVPEVIALRQLGCRVLAISTITNRAAGLSGKPLDHEEVLAAGRRVREKLSMLIDEVLVRWRG